MKRDYRDYGATWADYLDSKPGIFATWGEALRSLGGLLILVAFFIALFMWGLY